MFSLTELYYLLVIMSVLIYVSDLLKIAVKKVYKKPIVKTPDVSIGKVFIDMLGLFAAFFFSITYIVFFYSMFPIPYITQLFEVKIKLAQSLSGLIETFMIYIVMLNIIFYNVSNIFVQLIKLLAAFIKKMKYVKKAI